MLSVRAANLAALGSLALLPALATAQTAPPDTPTERIPPVTVTAGRGSDIEKLDVSTTVLTREQIEAAPQTGVDQIVNRIPGAQADLGGSESWSFTDRFYERLRYEIDPAWAGELPRTVMIDGDGKATVLPGVADLSRVRA